MKNIILFTKGLIIGTGKIIPGVSGAVMAILFGLYEPIIDSLSSVKGFKKNFSKLKFVILGIIISIIFGSNIINYFYTYYYERTIFLFLGMMMCSLISFKKELNFKKINYFYFLYVFLIIILGITLFNFPFIEKDIIISEFHYLVEIFASGIIEAFSSVVPGISGTAILLYVGYYGAVLNILSNPFSNIIFSIVFFLGIGIGAIIFSKLIKKLFILYENETKILSFIVSTLSVMFLFISALQRINPNNLFTLLVFFLIGYTLTSFFQNKIGNNC